MPSISIHLFLCPIDHHWTRSLILSIHLPLSQTISLKFKSMLSFIFQEFSHPNIFCAFLLFSHSNQILCSYHLWDSEKCGEFLMVNMLTCFLIKTYEKWILISIFEHNEAKSSVAVKPLMFVLCLLYIYKDRCIHALHIMTGLCFSVTTTPEELTTLCKFAFTQMTSLFLFINMLTIKLFVTLVMCLTGPSRYGCLPKAKG